jgi:hypothetical protein
MSSTLRCLEERRGTLIVPNLFPDSTSKITPDVGGLAAGKSHKNCADSAKACSNQSSVGFLFGCNPR